MIPFNGLCTMTYHTRLVVLIDRFTPRFIVLPFSPSAPVNVTCITLRAPIFPTSYITAVRSTRLPVIRVYDLL